ncbi:MAG: hypothetical protein J0H34_16480 [Rhizobiales bacterium]|nr:hypothetical protein [Hyphomicrobiales bacterium]
MLVIVGLRQEGTLAGLKPEGVVDVAAASETGGGLRAAMIAVPASGSSNGRISANRSASASVGSDSLWLSVEKFAILAS